MADPVTGTITSASFFSAAGKAALSIAISYAVSALTAPDVVGPRLDDLTAGGSSYGQPIPLAYGTVKLPGNVIWATDLIETSHTESAKGGPEITTYSYSQHIAVLVAANEVAGIRRIWLNGKLFLDASENAQSTGQSGNIRIYTGSETQTPDSLLEAYLGIGNVPAHRGYCYVVFEGLQLKDYGNRTPVSFEFEVVQSGDIVTSLVEVLDSRGPRLGDAIQQGCAVSLPGGRIAMAHNTALTDTPVKMIILDNVAGAVLSEGVTPGNAVASFLEYINGEAVDSSGVVTHTINEIWMSADSFPTSLTDIIRFNADTGQYIGTYSTEQTNNGMIAWCDKMDVAAIVSGPTDTSIVIMRPGGLVVATLATDNPPSVFKFITGDTLLWTDSAVDWAGSLQLFDMAAYAPFVTLTSSIITRSSTATTTELAFDTVRRRVIWTNEDSMPNVAIIDVDSMAITHTTTDAPYTSFIWYSEANDKLYAFGSPGSGQTSVIVINADTLQMEREFTVTSGGAGEHVREHIMESGLPHDYILTRTDDGLNRIPITNRLTANPVALSAIVYDLCERAGLSAGDIDVTQLTDMVHGYATT